MLFLPVKKKEEKQDFLKWVSSQKISTFVGFFVVSLNPLCFYFILFFLRGSLVWFPPPSPLRFFCSHIRFFSVRRISRKKTGFSKSKKKTCFFFFFLLKHCRYSLPMPLPPLPSPHPARPRSSPQQSFKSFHSLSDPEKKFSRPSNLAKRPTKTSVFF